MPSVIRQCASFLYAMLLTTSATVAHAGIILQDTGTTGIQINTFEPIAQSFTAEDSSIKFAFFFEATNPSFPNDPLEVKLVSGDGVGGTALSTVLFSVADNFVGYWDVDFSDVSLTIGSFYTAVLSVPGTSPYFFVFLNDNGNPYAGGRAYWSAAGLISNDASDDMRFRITPNAESIQVPEPGVLPLVAFGLVGLWASRRRVRTLRQVHSANGR